jgi:uncharacterized protein (DUF1501 family)
MTHPRHSSADDAAVSRRALLASACIAPLAVSSLGRLPARILPAGDDRTLLVLELVGGNDGLATVFPADTDALFRLRPTLARPARDAHRLGDGIGLHPALARVARHYGEGRVAIVQGVGYEPPDRSHFRSRDVWHAADPSLLRPTADTTGWLGRACDRLAAEGAATPGMSIGRIDVPLALRGRTIVAPAVSSLSDYALRIDPLGDRDAAEELAASSRAGANRPDDLDRFVREVADEALRSEQRLKVALSAFRPRAEFPADAFGQTMQLAARIIASGFGTRVLHAQLGGFDTHAAQAATHTALLTQLDEGLGALLDDLQARDALARTTIVVHSEFGRRVAENASLGTDHGAAAPVFVLGGSVRGGVYGTAPDLSDLDDGDVRVTCDFRRVYADALRLAGMDPAAAALAPGRAELLAPLGLAAATPR